MAAGLHPVRRGHTVTDRKTLISGEEKGRQPAVAVTDPEAEPAEQLLHLTADRQVVAETADHRGKTVS